MASGKKTMMNLPYSLIIANAQDVDLIMRINYRNGRGLKTVPATAWIALLLYSGLLIAGLLHPLIHPHEECGHAGDHHEQCDLARCLTVPLVLPEIVSVEVGLVYVDQAIQDLSDRQFDRDVITYAPPRGPPLFATQSIL